MPDLVGRTPESARNDRAVRILELDLEMREIDGESGSPGVIVRQSVAAGARVKTGTRVILWVATGGIVVPRVIDSFVRAAERRLDDQGFRPTIRTVTTDRGTPGRVVDQNPRAGERRPRGSIVEITVAQAPPDRPRPDPDDTRPPPDDVRYTRVPDVVGLEWAAAVTRLAQEGLQARPRPRRGGRFRVVAQKPRARARAAVGDTVSLSVVEDKPVDPPEDPTPPDPGRKDQDPAEPPRPDRPAKNPPEEPPKPRPDPPQLQAAMPRLIGRMYAQALTDADVRDLQLRLARQDDPFAPGMPGTIVRQSVAPGAGITAGSSVVTWTATGIVVPAVKGAPIETARQRLAQAGLEPRVRTIRAEGEPGTVLEQTPVAGTLVPRGAAVRVDLVETVAVPDVRRRSRSDADGILAAHGLGARFTDDSASTLAPGLVSVQDPAPETPVAYGTPVRLGVATGVSVPAVTGATLDDARGRLERAGLTTDEREVQTSSARPQTIAEQDPAAGTRVARGAVVRLAIAAAETARVPDLRDRSREEAARLLGDARLRAEFADDGESALPPERASAQQPDAGAVVPVGSPVRVIFPAGALVPPLLDATRDAARTRLEETGLRADLRVVLSETGSGTVVQQDPAPGTRVARGTPVIVTIAVAQGVAVPDLVGLTRADAKAALDAIGLRLAATEVASGRPAGTVIRQAPAAATAVGIGSTVRIDLAREISMAPPAGPVGPAPTPPQAPGVPGSNEGPAVPPVPRWAALAFAVMLIGLVTVRFFRANRAAPPTVDPPPHITDPPAPPGAARVAIEPRPGAGRARLEVSGRSLVDLEIALRVVAGAGQQRLDAGATLIGEERRLYE